MTDMFYKCLKEKESKKGRKKTHIQTKKSQFRILYFPYSWDIWIVIIGPIVNPT